MSTAFLLLPALALLSAADPSPAPLRVLVVTGGHDHPPSFYSVFENMGSGVKVNVDPHPRAFAYDMRKRYDVVVLYDMIKTGLDEAKRKNLQAFAAEPGKGVVVVHHALCSHGDWPWWYQEFAGARWIEPNTPGLAASTWKEDLDLEIRHASAEAAKHPVLAGIPASFRVYDEIYGKLQFAPGVEVLLKTTHPESDGPVVWIGPWKKSRVITVQLGHGSEAHHNSNYRKLVHNAIRWAAAGRN